MFDDDDNQLTLIRFTFIILIGVMFTAGFFLSSGLVVGQTTTDPAVDAQPLVIIQSRFMLWDLKEKSLDNDFIINLISWNNTTINFYSIQINNNHTNGSFYNFARINFTYNIPVLNFIIVKINNETIFYETNIKIIRGVTQGGIETIQEPYRISFLPFELTKFEWNLIFSGIVGVLISLPVSYFTVKYYRKHKSTEVI